LTFHGKCDGEFKNLFNSVPPNIWSKTRSASLRLKVAWDFSGGLIKKISFDSIDLKVKSRTAVAQKIRERCRMKRDERLLSLKSQGKTMDCIAKNAASHHFYYTGKYTRFADWRFIHRARLNTVPLRGNTPWASGDKHCRKCGYAQETLPHVLEHCKPFYTGYTCRHNAIVDRVKKLINGSGKLELVSENQTIDSSLLKPDLVATNGMTAYIFDITCPFENNYQAFIDARQRKETHYVELANNLKISMKLNKVEVVAIVVGALGTWDPKNDKVLSRLCSQSYLRMFRKLCVSDCIKWSRDLYIEFVSGKRQY
jgi:hypothetical protein